MRYEFTVIIVDLISIWIQLLENLQEWFTMSDFSFFVIFFFLHFFFSDMGFSFSDLFNFDWHFLNNPFHVNSVLGDTPLLKQSLDILNHPLLHGLIDILSKLKLKIFEQEFFKKLNTTVFLFRFDAIYKVVELREEFFVELLFEVGVVDQKSINLDL